MTRAHAKFSMSAAKRWVECPGSMWLGQSVPPAPSSSYAEEGTRAHAFAETILTAWLCDKRPPLTAYAQIEAEMDDDDMRQHVWGYIEFCQGLLRALRPKAVGIEKKVTLDSKLDIWGTADFCLRYEADGKFHGVLVDLKYGAGVPVEVKDNLQLAGYAASLMYEWDVESVCAYIYQPRAEHPDGPSRSVLWDKLQLEAYAQMLKKGARKALRVLNNEGEGAEFNVGDHCRWCPASGVCIDNAKAQAKKIGLDFGLQESTKFAPPDTAGLSDAQIARIVRYSPDIQAYLKAVYSYALQRVQAGEKIAGLKLVEGRCSPRRWRDDEQGISAALILAGAKDPWNKKLKPISEMEKIVGKEVVAQLTIPGSKPRLITHTSDPRPEIECSANAAALDFDDDIEG